jgi:hypothetical protein
VVHDEWDLKPGEVTERIYYPQFPEWAKEAANAGHGGGDFFTNHYFAEAIRTGEQPYLNVYRGVAMSVVGILAWKSVLDNGSSHTVPDFTREETRRAYEHDRWRPMDLHDPNAPPISSRGKAREIIRENLEEAREIWERQGYRGDDI